MSSKRPTSIVWKCFVKIEDNFVQCNQCQLKLMYHKSTSSLMHHLKSKHALKYDELLQEKEKEIEERTAPKRKIEKIVQPTLEQSLEKTILYPLDHPKRKELDKMVLDMVVTDLQPFQIVENRGFKKLVETLDKKYTLPSRTKLSKNLLDSTFQQEEKQVMDALQRSSYVSLTTDHWTSLANRGYLTVTAHCISPDWELQSFVLETARMQCSTTGENIGAEIIRIMEKFKIRNKVPAIVTDNASSMVVAMRDHVKIEHGRCFGHTLNLIVQSAVNKCEETSKIKRKIKDIVTFFHHSSKATDALTAELVKAEKKTLKLKQEVPTRWNSTFLMMNRYLELHEEVSVILFRHNKANLCLQENEVQIAKSAIKSLQIFDKFTIEMSAEKVTSSSKIIPIIHMINSSLSTDETSISQNLLKEMETRFSNPEENTLWAMSTILDPRFKQHCIRNEAVKEKIYNDMLNSSAETEKENTLTSEEMKREGEEETEEDEDDPWLQFDQELNKKFKVTATQETEIQKYFAENPVPRKQDPLKWWMTAARSYPLLSEEANKYLCIPASSVPSERLFSKAGELVSKKRSSLSDSTINKVLFLNKNLKM